MANGTGNREVEQHKAPPECEPIELRNEAANEEPKNIEYPQSPHSSVPEGPPPPENVPEVSTPTAPLHANILDSSIGYVLPFRHNRGKPPNRYNPYEEERKSKYQLQIMYLLKVCPSRSRLSLKHYSPAIFPILLRKRYLIQSGRKQYKKN